MSTFSSSNSESLVYFPIFKPFCTSLGHILYRFNLLCRGWISSFKNKGLCYFFAIFGLKTSFEYFLEFKFEIFGLFCIFKPICTSLGRVLLTFKFVVTSWITAGSVQHSICDLVTQVRNHGQPVLTKMQIIGFNYFLLFFLYFCLKTEFQVIFRVEIRNLW